ncbi:Pectin lyase-like protein [Mycena sanguinolenta]|uniref:galacturonan 1,4-alpha-galacturonidase n=1 Tax=Mycena sanguinolenta TaxID=230812 RepID=A0A8H6XH24_9AGAR|nr:Pectin lyase-like protein [Mycena sanguinolenta]
MLFSFLLLQAATAAFAWDTFLVPHTPGGDDTPGLLSLVTNHSSDATILFRKGITYNIFTAIKFPVLTNVEIAIEGNLTYPTNISEIQAIVGASDFPGSWFTFSGGNNVTLRGSTDTEWGWVDGHGQAWWDAVQQVNRPHGWAFNDITNGVIRDMKLWKPIGWNFATSGCVNVHVYNNKILAASDTSVMFCASSMASLIIGPVVPIQHRRYANNPCRYRSSQVAGFSAGGNNILFENNYVVNGDDCLTVGSGAHNITWRNSYCEGGHGLSIGSLGSGGSVADVQNVLCVRPSYQVPALTSHARSMETTIMNTTLYGARFKSWTGGNLWKRSCAQVRSVNSYVRSHSSDDSVTWKDITFIDVPFPIYVTQNYWDQELGPPPNNTNTVNNTHIQDFLFENFVGVIRDTPYVEGSCVTDPCWYFVPNATGREVVILDLYPGTATNVLAKDIFARTETGRPVAVMCNSTTVSNDVGFKCWDGPFIRTKAGL